MATYGFVGLGMMGQPMAENLTRHASAAGHRVLVWNRSPGRDAAALELGAESVADPADLVRRADLVVIMLPDLEQIEQWSFDIYDALRDPVDPTVLVICSSVSPGGIREYGARVRKHTAGVVTVVDAPVTGGTEGAIAGTLAIMMGGEDAAVSAALPVMTMMGRTVRHLGALGAGSVAKVCNQMVVSATMIALSEAVTLAESAGLDADALLTLLGAGYAGSNILATKRESLLTRSYPVGGKARYMVKDLVAGEQEAARLGLDLPQSALSLASFREVVAQSLGDQDMSVVHQVVRTRRRQVDGSSAIPSPSSGDAPDS